MARIFYYVREAELREQVDAFLEGYPNAPIAASIEGACLAVRAEFNTRSRQAWEALIAANLEFRRQVTSAIGNVLPLSAIAGGQPIAQTPNRGPRSKIQNLKSKIAKVRSYLRAKLGPRLPAAAAEARLAVCLACDRLKRLSDGRLFCAACGCGQRKDAELRVKTTMLLARCPQMLWPRVQAVDPLARLKRLWMFLGFRVKGTRP